MRLPEIIRSKLHWILLSSEAKTMSWQHFKTTFLIKFWSPIPAVIAAGILSTYYFGITGTFWAVTGEFTRWGGLLQLAGVHAEEWGYFKLIHLDGTPLTRIDGMMIIGMFGGCFAAALWANNVKLRLPQHRIRIVQAIVGGIIAGFGARLAMGCNLAAFFTGIPQFSLHAWFSPSRPPSVRGWVHALLCFRCSVSRSKCRKSPRHHLSLKMPIRRVVVFALAC
jgi:uncharacterized membrane protein YedE/YeeE